MTGFEPAALWSQTRCATKLRYIPILFLLKLELTPNSNTSNIIVHISLYVNTFISIKNIFFVKCRFDVLLMLFYRP